MNNEQISLFNFNEKNVNNDDVKREMVAKKQENSRETGKVKMTTESINNLFEIKESFELPESLMKKLLNKAEKDTLCNEFMKFEFDIRNDCLRDYFQMNNANRSNLKQDYTPDCLCSLISELAPQTNSIIDICSGTGALTIGMNSVLLFMLVGIFLPFLK